MYTNFKEIFKMCRPRREIYIERQNSGEKKAKKMALLAGITSSKQTRYFLHYLYFYPFFLPLRFNSLWLIPDQYHAWYFFRLLEMLMYFALESVRRGAF